MTVDELIAKMKYEAADRLNSVRITAEGVRDGADHLSRDDRISWYEDATELRAIMQLIPGTEGLWIRDTVREGRSHRHSSDSENDIPHKIEMIQFYVADTLTKNADYDDDQVREAAANAHTLCVEVTEALRRSVTPSRRMNGCSAAGAKSSGASGGTPRRPTAQGRIRGSGLAPRPNRPLGARPRTRR